MYGNIIQVYRIRAAAAEKLDKNTEIEKLSKALKQRRVMSACIVCAHVALHTRRGYVCLYTRVCTRKTKSLRLREPRGYWVRRRTAGANL